MSSKILLENFNEKYLDELSRIHRIAFSEHYNSKLGDHYTKAFLKWFGNGKDTIFIQAKESKTGKIIGYICGAKEGYGSRMNRDLISAIAVSMISRPWVMLDKRFFKMIIPKMKVFFSKKFVADDNYPDELRPFFSAVSLAVDPKAGEHKVPELLYEEFLKKAKEMGMKSVKGTVLKNNKFALVYYIHNKWSIFKKDSDSLETITIYKKL